MKQTTFHVVRDEVWISTAGLGTHNKSNKFQSGGGNYFDSRGSGYIYYLEWMNLKEEECIGKREVTATKNTVKSY